MQQHIKKEVIMDSDSDLMWQQLQARLNQRFGKYFKIDEEQSDTKTPGGTSHQAVNDYKTSSYYLSERIDI
jgi:hypothetical protein